MPTPVAVMEVRGVYGGLFLGVGAFSLRFAMRDACLRPGLVAQAGVVGGFVLGAPSAFYSTARQNHSSPRSLPEKFPEKYSWS